MDAILGTAGHIDHGKTSLVRALTGINCDRLDEEKRRGITIDLGFAWLDLPDGRRLGIIDVPGHERFVKTMVAGAAGIDCMLMVIAADEGVMPQTREHLDICALLGVKRGIVALTKTDMVDPEWLEMVIEDVRENLSGTFLSNAPIMPVSSSSGEGLEALRHAIVEMVATLKEKERTDILRLPVDRVFSLKGFGTVVTGTLVSGSCRQGEDLCVLPAARPVRARSLQVHGEQVKEARHGQRCAMNLQGAEVEDIRRGDVIARPDTLFPSRRWITRLTCLSNSPHPLRQRMEVHFHHGARECAAKLIFRDRMELAPGETAIVELHLAEPVPGIFGDRFVLRAHSPLRTIAGGILLDPLPPILRPRDPFYQQKLQFFADLGELAVMPNKGESERIKIVQLALRLCDAPGVDEKRLAALTGLPSATLKACLASLEGQGEAVCWDVASRSWIARAVFGQGVQSAVERAKELHEREPIKGYFAHTALCSGWGENLPSRYTQKVLEEAVKSGALKEEGNGLKLAEWKISLDESQKALAEALVKAIKDGAESPPTLRELQESMPNAGKAMLSVLAHLCETGQLARVQEGIYYSRPILENMLASVREWFESHDNLDIADMKTLFGVSRKYAIPLLEYMDGAKITYRVGNQRLLSKR